LGIVMPTGQINRVVSELRRICLHATSDRITDGQLLECFIGKRDESAFTLLVRRHGPMVLGVCRRILGNAHDADDAFQATFLVLVRKAPTVRPRDAVGDWLHGVAYRTALDLRGKLARQWSKERQVALLPEPAVTPEPGWFEVRTLLDGALSRLPEKYRLPIVLCDLEGRSRAEVACQLCIPEGTLSSRLAAGRQKLARRLARYGTIFTGASLATVMAENALSAAVPVPLVASTVKAATASAAVHALAAGVVSSKVATLTEGVIHTMFFAKLKAAAAVLVGVSALGLGTGGVIYQAQAGRPQDGTQVQRSGGADVVQAKRGEETRAREERLRLELDQARLEVQQLRERLERVRQEADERRESDEARLRQAQELLTRSQDARPTEREEVGRGRRRVAQAPIVRPVTEPGSLSPWSELQRQKAEMLEKFRVDRKNLEDQLRALDEHEKRMANEFDAKSAAVERQVSEARVRERSAPSSAIAESLEQILKRLEQMDQRLRRLEQRESRDRPAGGSAIR
jgi:RNA polymerase sigma factor (sigma-70 family)